MVNKKIIRTYFCDICNEEFTQDKKNQSYLGRCDKCSKQNDKDWREIFILFLILFLLALLMWSLFNSNSILPNSGVNMCK